MAFRISPAWCTLAAVAALALCCAAAAAGADASATDRMIAIYQRLAAARPQDAEIYYRLGDAYIEKGRETGDVSYFDLASKALNKSLQSDPTLAPAYRHLALVDYTLHAFAGAISNSQAALRLDSRDAYVYGVMGDAQLETGDYAAAARSYAIMAAIRADLYSLARRSALESLRGQYIACIADLKRAISDGVRTMKPAESVAWVQWQLGNEYFRAGNLSAASEQYQASLKTWPQYHRALAGIAQVRASQGDLAAAAERYKQAIAVIPMPEYAAALADVYELMGRREDSAKQRSLVQFIGRLSEINKVVYNRSLVYFYADHDIELPQALALAGAELKVRHDIYGHDAMAWAMYKSGRPRAAEREIRTALALETPDPRLYYHAGMIEFGLGRRDLARRELSRALALNPHFQPIQDALAAHALAALDGRSQ
jgi:tetratricopeptide (TPR) repeat protein